MESLRARAAVCAGLVALAAASLPARQSAFVPLLNGRSLEGWTVEAAEPDRFSVRDGVLHVEGPGGWLRSARQYANFVLRVEFRTLTPDADSGIFVRAVGDREFLRGWPGNSYQVQTRDISTNRTERPRLLGDLYRHGTPEGDTAFDPDLAFRLFKGTGAWHTWEIEARGDTLTVSLDGTVLTRASNIVNPTGYIGIQAETGALEYRRIDISER